jgi:aspartyl protease
MSDVAALDLERDPAMDPAPGSAEVFGLAGRRVDARQMVLRELRVGSVKMKNQPAVVMERDAQDAQEGDGLLPLHVFASVSFNCREGYLVVRAR